MMNLYLGDNQRSMAALLSHDIYISNRTLSHTSIRKVNAQNIV